MQRKNYKPEFKAKIALEAVKGLKTINEIAGDFGVHPNQVTIWKKALLEGAVELFADKRHKERHDEEALRDSLYQQIGQLKVELDWLKKKTRIFD